MLTPKMMVSEATVDPKTAALVAVRRMRLMTKVTIPMMAMPMTARRKSQKQLPILCVKI